MSLDDRKQLKITFAQINPTVGAARDNANLILSAYEDAFIAGADLLVCPEMVLSGYMTQDLVHKPSFSRSIEREIERLTKATSTGGPGILFGAPVVDANADIEPCPWPHSCWPHWRRVFNAALYVDQGRLQAMRYKTRLPDDSVYDDNRLFGRAEVQGPMNVRGVRIAVPICEDIWWDEVLETQAESGADMFISLNGSPWHRGKMDIRTQIATKAVNDYDLPFAYVNLVGGQDEIIFDGGSFVLNRDANLAMQMPQFKSSLAHTLWQREETKKRWFMSDSQREAPGCDLAQTYEAIMLGLRDYLDKNGCKRVLLGLSGGIDSALTALAAVDALGAENVHCVMMPSPYTSQDSLDDAAELAENLGIRLDQILIEPAMQAFDKMLAPVFDALAANGQASSGQDVTPENIQSRARGALLMALSNKTGALVLTTGNKSEIAVGYATLYGDMCGAYNVIGDLYKTQVFALSRWRNQNHHPDMKAGPGALMPERIISKPPSAELRPDQKDEDSLPPYDQLDAILERIIEREQSAAEIVMEGYDEAMVRRVWQLVDRAEFKRRQAAPAARVSSRAFGMDRRYPITNGHKET